MVFKPYFQKNTQTVPFFTSTQLATIYQYPTPNMNLKTVVGIVSFGGGLVGKVSPAGVLTDGDVQAHWAYLGIPSKNFPQVVIIPLDGAKNEPHPNDDATIENTIEVETIGAMYPSPNLTILLYIVPNSLDGFSAFLHATTFPITVNGQVYKPSVISCGWGASEQDLIEDEVSAINVQLKALAAAGITMTAATGTLEFPSSSPFCLTCGGTRLVCPNRVYDAQTVETAWTTGPSDISLVADPATGVIYTVGDRLHVIGGTSIVASAMAAFLAIVNSKQFIKPLLSCYPPTDFHPIVGSQGYGSIIGTNLAKSILTPHVPVTGISLNATLFTVNIGSTFTLIANVTPSDASNKSVQYSSSDTTIATVNSSGLVKGISAGSVTITANSGDFRITSVGTVPAVIPTSISITPSSVNVNAGRTTTLTPTILPSTSSNKTVRWSSSNTGIATVNPVGMVTGVGNGTATILAVTVSGEIQGESTVTVSTPVTGISVLPTSVSITVGGTIEIVPTIKPPTATNKTVNWTSNNKLIATVNSLGEIRGVKRGSTSVLATAGAYGATIKVVVK